MRTSGWSSGAVNRATSTRSFVPVAVKATGALTISPRTLVCRLRSRWPPAFETVASPPPTCTRTSAMPSLSRTDTCIESSTGNTRTIRSAPRDSCMPLDPMSPVHRSLPTCATIGGPPPMIISTGPIVARHGSPECISGSDFPWLSRTAKSGAAGFCGAGAASGRGGVIASHGELDAFDPVTSRFLRLTRTYGGVVGARAMRANHRIAYVTHTKSGKLGVGLVNLTTGRTSHAIAVSGAALRLAANPKGVAIRIGNAWSVMDDDGHMKALPAQKPSEWLDVTGRTARLHRAAPDGVAGDFDDQGLASAVRISQTNRTLSVPGQIDGSTIAWSPDRAHLAFVAQLDDSCTKPNAMTAAAFVADPSTGHVDEIARASGGLALEWIGDRELAIAGDRGVERLDLGGAATEIADADGLLSPKRRPRCAPEAAGSDEPETGEEPDVGDEGSDAPSPP